MADRLEAIALLPSVHLAYHVDFLTSFRCEFTIAQLFDRPFCVDCDVIMKKSANRCDVGPLANGRADWCFISSVQNTGYSLNLHKEKLHIQSN